LFGHSILSVYPQFSFFIFPHTRKFSVIQKIQEIPMTLLN